MRVTIQTLRAECPDWSWTAQRSGMGWRYLGTKNGITVVVRRHAVLVGEDDFETRWYVDDGTVSVDYATWWVRQESRDGAGRA